LLLVFNDMPAYLPTGAHLNGIHRPQGLLARRFDQETQLADKGGNLG
jgi:hypothetical protein